jgi:hypothetical protein
MTKAKLGTFAKNSNVNPMNSNPRCKGQTKTGKPCRAAAVSAGKCLFRANPKKVSAVRDAVEGKLHPRVAPGLAPPLNSQPRAVEATDLERLP